MTRRSWLMMGGAAAVWGASYMFIKVALDDFSEGAIVCIRTALGAAVLLALARRWDALAPLRGRWPWSRRSPCAGRHPLPADHLRREPHRLPAGRHPRLRRPDLHRAARAGLRPRRALARLGRGRDRRRHARRRPALRARPVGQQRPDRRRPDGPAGQPLLRGRRDALQAQAARRSARRRGRRPDGRGGLVTLPLCLADLPEHAPSFKAAGALVLLGDGGHGHRLPVVLHADLGDRTGAGVGHRYIAPGFSVVYGVVLLGEAFSVAAVGGLGSSWPARGWRSGAGNAAREAGWRPRWRRRARPWRLPRGPRAVES